MDFTFDYLNPVTDPDYLWGREADLAKIFSRINAERPQSVSIVGGRKIGKTSFINVMNSPLVKEKYLNDAQSFLFLKLYIDEKTEASVGKFFGSLTELAKNHPVLKEIHIDGSNEYNLFQEFIHLCMEEKKKVILILDDFHLITSNPVFPLEFFSFLRSMANSYNVAYITTSRLELQKLCYIKDVEESPFFNIFSNYNLKLLTENHIRQPVSEVLEKLGIGNIGQEVLWRNAAHHPYILQVVGSLLLKHKAEEVEAIAQERLTDYFNQLWNGLNNPEKKALKTLTMGYSLPAPMKHIIRELCKRSVLREENGDFSFFTPLFRTYIIRQHVYGGKWLKKLFSKRWSDE